MTAVEIESKYILLCQIFLNMDNYFGMAKGRDWQHVFERMGLDISSVVNFNRLVYAVKLQKLVIQIFCNQN